ncbi:MAG: ROK family protein [Clostridia bacterium]|nr:ROK family protein [Clostridia bacterium]
MKNLLLYPECKDNIWGGTKLKTKYGKATDRDIVAESWELSYHKDGPTRTEDGATLSEALTNEEIGTNCSDFSFFPVLVKLIDAKDDLSVQVHPSDSYALENENSFGKTEMWYIVEAEEGAGIYLGFKKDVTEDEYKAAIKNNTLTDLLNFYEVKAGECYFIPSGTIHAIGSGCLICEIQQNSNLTYRVYDYGRRDKNGNTRELHIEKALKVTSLKKYEACPLGISAKDGELLGVSRYFTVTKLDVKGATDIACDAATFKCFTCVEGEATVGGERLALGKSRLVSAHNGKIEIKGNATVIMTQIRKYYVGIDLGGTFIKGGIVDDLGNIIYTDKIPTEGNRGQDAVAENIARLAKMLLARTGLSTDDVEGIGMGVPGMIDSEKGIVLLSNNLRWYDFHIAEAVSSLTGLRVKIANDANVAVLAEAKFGAAKNRKNVIMLTLGTGVGGGIIANGALYEGNMSVGAELGHMVIKSDGERCTCGRQGCLEAYASASALIRETKKAMQAHPESKMWQTYTPDNASGKTAFDYKDTDEFAKEVVDRYIQNLATGITNLVNIFRPEVVLLGGGVCAEGDNLIIPLQRLVNEKMFAGKAGPESKILIATLGNTAGTLGAASLLM